MMVIEVNPDGDSDANESDSAESNDEDQLQTTEKTYFV